MATTNDPLQGGPTPSPNPGADPVKQLAPKALGQPSHDDHDTSGPPAPEVIARGYEEDVYDTKTVLSVPLLVVFFFVVAFAVTTGLFVIFSKAPDFAGAHPQAKDRNAADLNARLARIQRGKEVDQPRLDQLDRLDSRYDPRIITRTRLQDGTNSPHLHPEDLIPSKDRTPELYGAGAALDKTLALGNDDLKKLFKSSAPALPVDASQHAPSGANAGRGAEGSAVVPPKAPEAKKGEEPKKQPAPMPKEGKQ